MYLVMQDFTVFIMPPGNWVSKYSKDGSTFISTAIVADLCGKQIKEIYRRNMLRCTWFLSGVEWRGSRRIHTSDLWDGGRIALVRDDKPHPLGNRYTLHFTYKYARTLPHKHSSSTTTSFFSCSRLRGYIVMANIPRVYQYTYRLSQNDI